MVQWLGSKLDLKVTFVISSLYGRKLNCDKLQQAIWNPNCAFMFDPEIYSTCDGILATEIQIGLRITVNIG